MNVYLSYSPEYHDDIGRVVDEVPKLLNHTWTPSLLRGQPCPHEEACKGEKPEVEGSAGSDALMKASGAVE